MMKNLNIIFILLLFPILSYAQDQAAAREKLYEGQSHMNNKEPDKALAKFTEAISLDSTLALAYSSRGLVYYLNFKEYQKAIADFNTVIRLEPNRAHGYYSRARLYKYMERYADAIKDYTKAIDLEEDTDYYLYRSEAYIKTDQRALALADLNKVIELEPSEYHYGRRANFYENIKENKLALQDYDKCVLLRPDSDRPYYLRGSFHYRKQQYNLAIADMTKAIAIKPGSPFNLRGRADVYRAAGAYSAAINDYLQSLKVDTGEFVTAFLTTINLVSPLVRAERWEEAQKYASLVYEENIFRYIRENPMRYFIDVVRTDLPAKKYKEALGKLDLADREFSTLNLDEYDQRFRYTDVLFLKAYIMEKLGNYGQAKALYEQALLINPSQPDVKLALSMLADMQITVAANDVSAPEIQLISPQPSRGLQVVAAGSKSDVIGKAKDASGIASVTINGVAIAKIEEDGLFVTSLVLKPGANTISIVAIDKKGNTATQTFSVLGTTVAPVAIVPVAEAKPVFHAILIAANDYEDSGIQDLVNPVADAKGLEAILQTNYTFDKENFITLYNKSREDIMQAIVQKSSAMGANDNLIIFYAGHGTAEKDKFGDVDGYWIPSSATKGVNASYISADDINKALKRSEARHILVIADACFSGAFTRSMTAAPGTIQRQYDSPSRKIMASGNMEPVPDNSVFLKYLKQNLTKNQEKYMTAKTLFDSFYEAVLNNSETLPQFAAIKNVGDEGGQFVFIKK
ncbi:MAG: tetratricopeptide repeat protein [Bacteroidota bacterium]